MCGIAGFCRHPADQFNANELAKTLLLGIEHRGKDATGAAWRDRRGYTVSTKYPVKATDFVERLSVDSRADVAVLHTRFATQGHQSINVNNHPLYAGPITGVHNGMVSNDYELLASAPNYKKQGTVDSQAIFATLNRVDDTFTLKQALELIEAKMAVAWLDDTDPDAATLHLARGDGSPLVVGQTAAGTLIFASTEQAVLDGAKSVGLELTYLQDVEEGTYFTVHQGRIVKAESFFPTPMFQSYSGYYSKNASTTPKKSSTAPATGTSWVTTGGTTVRTYVAKTKDDMLDMTYLDPDKHIPQMSYKDVHEKYPKRDKEIADWIELHASDTASDDADLFDRAAERGAFLRPGSWVNTYVCGQLVDAQVYRLPHSFPEGDYIVRVLAPVYGHDGEYVGVEATYLARTIADLVDGEDLYVDNPEVTTKNEKESAHA